MEIRTRKVDNVVFLDISGRLDAGEPLVQIRETLLAHMNSGERNFVVNLKEVSYIDSGALGALVAAYTIIRSKGGDVKLLVK